LLTSIVAEYLFQYYPLAKEGALTKLRAKIVSRVKLNQIGKEMGLLELAQISNHHKNFGDDIHGNLLESLIGALFIDRGYEKTKGYVIKNIILPHVDMDRLDSLVLSYKAFLIEWGQKQKKEIRFITEEDTTGLAFSSAAAFASASCLSFRSRTFGKIQSLIQKEGRRKSSTDCSTDFENKPQTLEFLKWDKKFII